MGPEIHFLNNPDDTHTYRSIRKSRFLDPGAEEDWTLKGFFFLLLLFAPETGRVSRSV